MIYAASSCVPKEGPDLLYTGDGHGRARGWASCP